MANIKRNKLVRKSKSKRSQNLDENWKYKTIEFLENDYWKESEFNSYLVKTCHKLRKKQLIDFEIEDLRILIGQNIALLYLVPMALDILEKDILAEGDFYEGDLLKSLLTTESNFWRNDIQKWNQVCKLFERNTELLKSFQTTENIKAGWFEAYDEFKKIN